MGEFNSVAEKIGVYIEMSFGERCQLFQHFKFLCQVRIFSSNYIILIFWSIHVWYMVIRVIGKKNRRGQYD